MNIRILPFTLILAASAAVIIPLPAQGNENNRNVPEPGSGADREQRLVETIKRMTPLAAELMRLQRSSFETPEARQQAIRQWHATHGASLKAEIDARREIERPELERLEREANSRFEKTLDDGVTSGKFGKLEAEFIRLTRTSFTSTEQRRDVIARWRAENGAALDAEREKRRAKEAPRIAVLQAEALVRRRQQMDDALKNGQIGPREAELMELHYNQDLAPAARQEAIREWMSAHGVEFKSEQAARRQRIPAESLPSSLNHPPAPQH